MTKEDVFSKGPARYVAITQGAVLLWLSTGHLWECLLFRTGGRLSKEVTSPPGMRSHMIPFWRSTGSVWQGPGSIVGLRDFFLIVAKMGLEPLTFRVPVKHLSHRTGGAGSTAWSISSLIQSGPYPLWFSLINILSDSAWSISSLIQPGPYPHWFSLVHILTYPTEAEQDTRMFSLWEIRKHSYAHSRTVVFSSGTQTKTVT